jgi:hypothetical protein
MKTLLLVFMLTFSVQGVQAQFSASSKKLELGISVCATNYSGDIAPDHISGAQTRAGAGAFIRLHLNDFFQVRGQLFVGRLAGDDKNHAPNAGRQLRFNTTVLEGAALLEGSVGVFKYEPVTSDITYYFSPYLFAGVGAARVNAQASYYGPENERDRLLKVSIPERGSSTRMMLVTPFGMGLRMIAGERLGFGLELGVRPVYEDLLDGVSLNGNPEENDWYYTLGVSVSYFVGGL